MNLPRVRLNQPEEEVLNARPSSSSAVAIGSAWPTVHCGRRTVASMAPVWMARVPVKEAFDLFRRPHHVFVCEANIIGGMM